MAAMSVLLRDYDVKVRATYTAMGRLGWAIAPPLEIVGSVPGAVSSATRAGGR
jgi:hypothetical protein